jgi:hypothetical protein
MTYELLLAFHGWAQRLAERLVSGRFACERIALLATIFGLVFTSFPNYPKLWDDRKLLSADYNWEGILEKRDHPFLDMALKYGEGHHNANANYRLIVPLAAKVLGLGVRGIFALQSVCAVLLLWVVARVASRATGDHVASFFVTCGVASTWSGTMGFMELYGVFDGEALLLVCCAALFETPWLVGLCVFLGAWTDERALVASSLVLVYQVARRQRDGADWRASYLGAAPIAVVVAWVAYFAARFAISFYSHMSLGFGSANLKWVLVDANNGPLASWTALEGGWLLVLAAIVVLVRQRRPLFLLAYCGAISVMLLVAMSVIDITRSMAYMLPAIFVALEVLAEVETGPHLRGLCAASSAVSVLWPNYYCYDRDRNLWKVPLPMRLVQWALGISQD